MIGYFVITNPYVGPRPFETGQPLFGRDRELAELRYKLTAERIVLLYSPSGAGKSSLINAGLIPKLKDRFEIIGPVRVNAEPSLSTSNRFIESALSNFTKSPTSNSLIVFDQFEEILRIDPNDTAPKRAFFTQLGDLLSDPTIWALFVLREDYLAPLDPYVALVPTHLQNRYRLDRLNREAATQAIERPAESTNRKYAPGVVRTLVDNLANNSDYVEPLQLQVVCYDVWERATTSLIQTSDLGDISNSLRNYYDNAVKTTATDIEDTERDIRQWFQTQLITTDGVRNQVRHEKELTGGLSTALVLKLLDTYLVRAEPRSGITWYELAHDRLVAPIRESNRDWLDQHLNKLQKAAALWLAEGKKPALLLLGADLEAATAEAANTKLHHDEQLFLDSSHAEQNDLEEKQRAMERERAQARSIKKLAWACAAVAVLAVIASIIAWQKTQSADANLKLAQTDEQKAKIESIKAGISMGDASLAQGNALLSQHEEVIKQQEANQSAQAADISAKNANRNLVLLFHEKADRSLAVAETSGSAADYQNAWIYSLATFTNSLNPEPEALGILLTPEVQPGYKPLPPPNPCTPTLKPIDRAAFAGSHLVCSIPTIPNEETNHSDIYVDGKSRYQRAVWIRSLAATPSFSSVIMGVNNGQVVSVVGDAAWNNSSTKPSTALAVLSDGGKLVLATGTEQGHMATLLPGLEESPRAARFCIGQREVCPEIQSLAWKPGPGHTLAAGLVDGSIHFFRLAALDDALDPSPLPTVPAGGPAVTALAFWPGTSLLISGHSDGRLRVWDTLTGRQLASANKHQEALIAMQFDPQANELTTISKDGIILKTPLHPTWFNRSWDLTTLLRPAEGRALRDQLYLVSRQNLGFDSAQTEPKPLPNASVFALKYFNFGAVEHFTPQEAAAGKLLIRGKYPPNLTFPTIDDPSLIHLMPDLVEGARSAVLFPATLDPAIGFKAEFQYRIDYATLKPVLKSGDGFSFFFYKDPRLLEADALSGVWKPDSGYAVGFDLFSGRGFSIGIYGPNASPNNQIFRGLMAITGLTPETSTPPIRSSGWRSVCIEAIPSAADGPCHLGYSASPGVNVYFDHKLALNWTGKFFAASGGLGFTASTGEPDIGIDIRGLKVTPSNASAPIEFQRSAIKLRSKWTPPTVPVLDANRLLLTTDDLYQASAVFLPEPGIKSKEYSIEFEYNMSAKSADPYSTGSGITLMFGTNLEPYKTQILPEGEERAVIPSTGHSLHFITNQRRVIELRDPSGKVLASHSQSNVFTAGEWRKVRVEIDTDVTPHHVHVFYEGVPILDATVTLDPKFQAIGFTGSTGILYSLKGTAEQSIRNVVIRNLKTKTTQ